MGSRGLRAFKHYSRREFRNTNKIDDIPGTAVGSLVKAPVTNRMVNPLMPVYPLLGATEVGNHDVYAENISKNANKPLTAPVKSRAQRLIRNQNEKPPNFDKEVYKRDIAKFYSTNPGFMQEIDFKKIQQA